MLNDNKTAEIWQEIIDKKDAQIDKYKKRNTELEHQITWLLDQLKLSKHRQFGASSEQSKYDLNQTSLFNEAEQTADLTIPEPDIEEVKSYRRKKSRNAIDRLPPDLDVEIITHELPENERSCPNCNGQLHVMGRETREELKLIPARAVIVRHVRHVYACRDCEKNGTEVPIVKAEMPNPVIKGSFASPEAIAHIASQKFVMGIPLYRQEQEWERNGIHLSRQTMSNWLIKATMWLILIYNRLHELLCEHDVAHADETTVQVLHEEGKKAQSNSYMWLYRTSGDAKHHIVLYEYQPSREGKHPKEFLKGFNGFLHSDGYERYHELPENITNVGCWAHVQRKFDEALKIIPEKDRIGTNALHGKHFCQRLFSLERKFSELTPDERFEQRIKLSKPVIDEFFKWTKSLKVLPKSLIGQAAAYALNQQKWLENVLLDGRLELSNNRAERSIKPFVIGRKNWLFSNTPKGAESSAILYSLIETAKENGLNPYEYLTAVFRTAPNLPEGSSVDDLLPWNLCGRI